jgi:hypothetical protein
MLSGNTSKASFKSFGIDGSTLSKDSSSSSKDLSSAQPVVIKLVVANQLDNSQETSDDTFLSLFPEVVEFVIYLGVELEDNITDMLAIKSDNHPVASMNLRVIMGSNDPGDQSKQTLNCPQLMTTSDTSAMVLPYDRGPVKVLTISTGSLKLLPFDCGPASPLSVLA